MPNNEIQVAYRRNPFALGHVDRVVAEGVTVAEMIAEIGLAPIAEVHDGVFVYVNDELVERSRWQALRLVRGSIVAVGVAPAGGGGGGQKDPTRTVAMIAVMVIAIAATYFLGPAGGYTTWTAGQAMFAGAAVSMAGSLLVSALIPLPTDKQKSTSGGPSYISGMSNRMDPYGPVPRLFGKHKIYPRFAALPYTELVGTDEQYLRCLFVIGKGKYELTNFKIGDTLLTSYTDVELERYYTGDSTVYRLFPNDPAETALTIQLLQSAAQTRTTGADIDEIAVELTFPAGLYQIGSSGRRRAASVTAKIEYSLTGAGVWRDFTNFRRLNFAGQPSTSIAVGQTVIGPAGEGTIRNANQSGWSSVTGGSGENGDPIYASYYWTSYVDVEVTSGSFSDGEAVTIAALYAATITTVIDLYTDISGEYGSPVKKALSVKVPRGTYDVRVTKTSADSSTNNVCDVYWTTLRTITYQTPVALTGCTLVALRIKATGQLNGMLDQFNCVAEALTNAWNGATWEIVKSRNPAWAFIEVLCGTSNKRAIATSRLDLTTLRSFSARCAAAGFNFDAIVDYKTTAWDVLRQICATARATPGMTDNKYTVIEDQVRTTPVQHFSPRNSWNFSGSRVFPDVPHALRIRFPNEDKDYTEDECVVYDDGYTSVTATLYETLEFFGVTDYDHAWKLGRYHLAVMRLRPETYTFDTDVEHMVCTRGDLVRITHDVLMVGISSARIKTITTIAISVDDVLSMEGGKTYGFQFRRADGTFKTCVITTSAGEKAAGTVLTINPAMAAGDLPAVGDLCFFGETASVSLNVIVSRIEPGPDLTARVTCVPYNAAIYTADSGAIPAWTSNITLPPVVNRTPPAPKIIDATYSYRGANINADGTYDLVMSVGFDLQDSGLVQSGTADPATQAPDVAQGFNAEYREDEYNNLITNGDMELDANWTSRYTPTENERSVAKVHGGTYSRKFSVDAVAEGIYSDAFTVSLGDTYCWSLWVYPTAGATKIRVQVSDGANNTISYVNEFVGLTPDAWNFISGSYQENTEGGALAAFYISSETQASGTWYIDDVVLVLENDGNWLPVPSLGRAVRGFEFAAKDGCIYDIRVRSYSTPGAFSDWDTLSNVAVSYVAAVPATVTGLAAIGGGTAFLTKDLEVTWTAVPGGGDTGATVTDYKIEVKTSDGATLLRTEYVTQSYYLYDLDKNLADGGPRAAVQIKVWARNKFNALSVAAASQVFTNVAPATPSGLGSTAVQGGVEFYWSANTEIDLKYYQTRTKVTAGGTFSSWATTLTTGLLRLLTPTEKDASGVGAAIYIEVKATDIFAQDSAAAAANLAAGSLDIKATDIDTFAITASKIFTKIPIVESLVLTPNSPAAGEVAWSACTVYYNGVAYSITAGHAEATYKYIYWKYEGTSFLQSITHPAPETPNLATWNPEQDFIIAINIGGIGQAAWNGIANQVIGSAYIMNAAINDAQVNTLSGTKINAQTSVSIGSATYATDGIQLEYNGGDPRFYAGNGTNQYIKFDGTNLILKGQMEIIGSQRDSANMLLNPGFEDDLTYWAGARISIAASGNNSNKSLEMTMAGGSYAYAYQTKPDGTPLRFEVNYGEVYELNADFLCDASGISGYLYAFFYDKDLADISNINVSTTSQTWIRKRLEIVIPSNCKFLEVYLTAANVNGTVYVDNCVLTRIDALANSWASSTDRTKIDGGNIHASTSLAIGPATTFGTDGVQLEYNAGNPRFYVGNGTNKYLQFDGTTVTIRGTLVADDITSGTLSVDRVNAGSLYFTKVSNTDAYKIIPISTVTAAEVEEHTDDHETDTAGTYETATQVIGSTTDRVLLHFKLDSWAQYGVGVADFDFYIYRYLNGSLTATLYTIADWTVWPSTGVSLMFIDDPAGATDDTLKYRFRYYMYGASSASLGFYGSSLTAIQFRR